MNNDDDLLAAELALGLTGDAAASARRASDAVFGARVIWWEQRFIGLTAELSADPSPQLWTRIAAKLPANDNRSSVVKWQVLSAALAGVAAVALFVSVQRPTIELAPPADAPAVASLSGEKGSAVAISYDGSSRRLTVAPLTLDPGKGDAELWIIPVGHTEPISLGVIDTRKPSSHQVSPAQARLVAIGATFAISLEQIGGSPTGHATGPIVASGKLVET